MWKFPVDLNTTLTNKMTQVIIYASHINTWGRSKPVAKEEFLSLHASKIGLIINENKTKAMTITQSDRRIEQNWAIDDKNIKSSDSFCT